MPPLNYNVIIITIITLLGITTPAYAYIDPNAGGLLFQILTPLFAILAVALTTARQWVSRKISKIISFF